MIRRNQFVKTESGLNLESLPEQIITARGIAKISVRKKTAALTPVLLIKTKNKVDILLRSKNC